MPTATSGTTCPSLIASEGFMPIIRVLVLFIEATTFCSFETQALDGAPSSKPRWYMLRKRRWARTLLKDSAKACERWCPTSARRMRTPWLSSAAVVAPRNSVPWSTIICSGQVSGHFASS